MTDGVILGLVAILTTVIAAVDDAMAHSMLPFIFIVVFAVIIVHFLRGRHAQRKP